MKTGPGLSDNLLQVNVYYKSLNVKQVLEKATYPSVSDQDQLHQSRLQLIVTNPQMTDSSFITALGGALNLFLGITLSIVFEVIEFLIDFTINVTIHCSKKEA